MNILQRILLLGQHTCPWWLGYTFDNPLRRLVHDPKKILGDFVEPGHTVVDIGCGLGYFSIALAKIVGPEGKVIALDIQQQMIQRASRRAERHGIASRIDFRLCKPDHLGVEGPVDFVLAFWVVHEVEDPENMLIEVRSFLQPQGQILIAEPKGHVSASRFSDMAELARSVGFKTSQGPVVRFSRSVVCTPNQVKFRN